MYYPQFEVPRLGGGLLIAIVAITHVVIAHFAIGAGIFNAVAETYARRRNEPLLLRFLYDHTRFLILFAFIAGAVTGVGIWFTTALVSPRAISALIHNFVWGWAIEWVFFAVEIVSGYVYYYGWNRLSPRHHVIVGWIYAVAAWLSLFVINGILCFMLSPPAGFAPGRFSFWPAFFNATQFPSLLLRTVSALAIVAIFCCVVVNASKSYTSDERKRIVNFSAWFLAPLALMLPLAAWWFAAVPEPSRRLVFGGAVAITMFFLVGIASSVLIGAYAYLGLIRRKRNVNLETSLLLLGIALMATGSMEFVREGIRKPYVIPGYLWSTGIADRPEEIEAIHRDGILAHAPWVTGPQGDKPATSEAERGLWVFQAQCAQCHVRGGYNDVGPLIATWRRDMIRSLLDELHERKPFMPPCLGTRAEKEWLTTYLHSMSSKTGDRDDGPSDSPS